MWSITSCRQAIHVLLRPNQSAWNRHVCQPMSTHRCKQPVRQSASQQAGSTACYKVFTNLTVNIGKNLNYCFTDVDGSTILEDYCFFTYATSVYLDKYCMPFPMNTYREAIQTTVNGYFQNMRNIAHDIYGVIKVAQMNLLTFVCVIVVFQAADIIIVGYIGSIFIGYFYMTTLLVKSKLKYHSDD